MQPQDQIPGIHHITVLASDPQRNLEFYADVLGMRLVKRTINFDAPGVYHLYYGDDIGTPGTLLTFFPFPNAARGKRGSGEIHAIGFRVPAGSLEYWVHRLSLKGISFDGPSDRFGDTVLTFLDPDGLTIDLIERTASPDIEPWTGSPVPAEHQLRGFAGVTMGYLDDRFSKTFLAGAMGFRQGGSKGTRTRFLAGPEDVPVTIDTMVLDSITPPRQSAGSVHHIAWSVPDDAGQQAWRTHLMGLGSYPTEVRDRNYFRSIYFREPGGVLFEIATDGPGFLIDEERSALGAELRLPAWFEPQRAQIERSLIPIDTTRPYLAQERA